MTRAAVYLRQSLDKTGDGVAVARQRQDCLKLCAAKGWEAVEYVDNDCSASNGKHRPAYEKMLADIEAGSIGAVVCWDLDRLHRRPIELESFMALADEKHLALATVSGDVDLSTAQGRLVARLKGSVAAHEIEHKRGRQVRAARQKAERGEPNWRKAFGYLDGTRQPDPQTAPLVKQAYAQILAGGSLGDVCRAWNAAGAPTSLGHVWTAERVSKLLRRPLYAGLRAYRGEIVGKGNWPGLVDESTWRAAQTVLDDDSRKPGRKSVRRHLLTGVVLCGKCGHYLSASYVNKDYRTDRRVLYRCTACLGVSISAENLEPLVYDIVAGRLAMSDAVDLLKAELHDDVEAEKLRVEKNALLTELDSIGVERGEGLLTGKQAQIATGIVNAKLESIERRQTDQERLRVFDGLPLGEPEVSTAVHNLSPDRFRAVLDVLCEVTVAPVGKTGRRFDPERVKVAWR